MEEEIAIQLGLIQLESVTLLIMMNLNLREGQFSRSSCLVVEFSMEREWWALIGGVKLETELFVDQDRKNVYEGH